MAGYRPKGAINPIDRKFAKAAKGIPLNFISNPDWAGEIVASEAASYIYSQVAWRLRATHMATLFGNDVFGQGYNPRELVRKLVISIRSRNGLIQEELEDRRFRQVRDLDSGRIVRVKKRTPTAHNRVGQFYSRQIQALSDLRNIPNPEGFQLKINLYTEKCLIVSYVEAFDTINEFAPLLFKLKEVGFVISIRPEGFGSNEDLFDSLLSSIFADWEKTLGIYREEFAKVEAMA